MGEYSRKNFEARAVLVGVTVLVFLIAYYSGWRGVSKRPASRMVDLTYSLIISDIPDEAENVRVWIPMPLTNLHQKLCAFYISDSWPYEIVKEDEYGNRFLVFDISAAALRQSSEAVVTIDFLVTRYANHLLKRRSLAYLVPINELTRHLEPDRMIPIDGKIAEEAYRIAGSTQDQLKQSRLLYDNIVDTLSYDKSGIGWGNGDAIYACDIRKGNCTDFHSLFIGQARALHIPARFIMGLPLPEDDVEGIINGYHCWGEFYLAEKGWIPIDASEANKFPEKKEMFFGGLDENRIAFTIGRDIKLPESMVEALNYVIYPHVEIDGRWHDNVQTTFYFKDYPIGYEKKNKSF